jgi:hypothetical protein
VRIAKYIISLALILVFLILIVLLTPVSNAYLLTKLSDHFLHVKSRFDSPAINFDSYDIRGSLDKNTTIEIHIDYSTLLDSKIDIHYDGDIKLFSYIATVELPSIDIDLNISLDDKVRAYADILDGTLEAEFDIDTMSYDLKADGISLLSYQNQQSITPYVSGEIYFDSQGLFSELTDINLTLSSDNILMLKPAIEKAGVDINSSPALFGIKTDINLHDDIINSQLEITSDLLELNTDRLLYDINKSSFDIALHVKNHLKQFEPLKELHVNTAGTYKEERLLAKADMDLDGYLLQLDDLSYIDEALHVRYTLSSKNRQIVDISDKHHLYGDVSFIQNRLKAYLSSLVLKDKIEITYQDNTAKINSPHLSLDGLLIHLKQEPMIKANLALKADIDLTKELRYTASLDSSDIRFSQEIEQILRHHTNTALHVKVHNDKNSIIIKPRIDAKMLSLYDGDIIYDLNSSHLQTSLKLKDINISMYHSPALSLTSTVDLGQTLHVSTDINSTYEDIKLTLSKKQSEIKADISFDFTDINRITELKDILHVRGDIDLDSKDDIHNFKIRLKDINTSFYQTKAADINGTVIQKEQIDAVVDLKTVDENLHVKLNSDTDKTDATFRYRFRHLDRFAKLNPQFVLIGSGDALVVDDKIDIKLDAERLAQINLQKNRDNIDVDIKEISLAKVFDLLNQKPILDANISLKAQMTPEGLHVKADSPMSIPQESNSSLRPTPLHVRVDLDTNQSYYSGNASIKTDYEAIVFDNIEFLANEQIFKSDFSISSSDLQKAVVVLPESLVGKTELIGDISYDKVLLLHVRDDSITLSEKFHKKVDENASGILPVKLKSVVKLQEDVLDIDFLSSSPYYDIHSFKTTVDLNSTKLNSTLKMTSNYARHKAELNLKMHYTNPYLINATLETDYEEIILNNIKVDTKKLDLNGSYKLNLTQTPKLGLIQHGDAKFTGELSHQKIPKITLFSNSFDGDLNVTATQKNIFVDAKNISLEKVMDFIDAKSALESGNFDLDVNLSSSDFVNLDLNTIKGDILLDATDMLLVGIDADKSINKLRNYQDISIFKGQFPGMGIVNSIVDAPENMLNQKSIQSKIERVYAASYIDNGRFYCYDCAVKTEQNRIAVKGAIDLNTTDFQHFQIGLLKDNGCPFFVQDIKGSVENPDIELSKTSLSLVTGTVKSVGGVLKDGVDFTTMLVSKTGGFVGNTLDATTGKIPVVKRASGAVSGTVTTVADAPDKANGTLSIECQPFYRGLVSPALKKR